MKNATISFEKIIISLLSWIVLRAIKVPILSLVGFSVFFITMNLFEIAWLLFTNTDFENVTQHYELVAFFVSAAVALYIVFRLYQSAVDLHRRLLKKGERLAATNNTARDPQS